MGKRGPKPLGSEELRKRNSWLAPVREKQERAQTKIRSDAAVKLPNPTCPAWLSKRGKSEWRRVVPWLCKIDLFTCLDMAMLATYCEAVGAFIAANEQIQLEGSTFQAGDEIKPHPAVRQRDAAHRLILMSAKELALSPGSRDRLGVDLYEETESEPEPKTGVAKFFA